MTTVTATYRGGIAAPRGRNRGQSVTVVRPLAVPLEADPEVGPMFLARFADGSEAHVFADELDGNATGTCGHPGCGVALARLSPTEWIDADNNKAAAAPVWHEHDPSGDWIDGTQMRVARHRHPDPCKRTAPASESRQPVPFDDDPSGDNWTPPGITDGTEATCRRCGRRIAWGFDVESDENRDPVTSGEHGWWYDTERAEPTCTPGPGDVDRWHSPEPIPTTDPRPTCPAAGFGRPHTWATGAFYWPLDAADRHLYVGDAFVMCGGCGQIERD